MIHNDPIPPSLPENELREAIIKAIAGQDEHEFHYDAPTLLEKLEEHGVTMEDLLHVCHYWEICDAEWDYEHNSWCYGIEGEDLDERWMRVVVAVNASPKYIIAVTGYTFSRGRKKRGKS